MMHDPFCPSNTDSRIPFDGRITHNEHKIGSTIVQKCADIQTNKIDLVTQKYCSIVARLWRNNNIPARYSTTWHSILKMTES